MQKTKNLKRDSWSKVLNWLFLLGAIAIFLYTFYRAEVTFNGERADTYTKYYVISLTLISFYALALRAKNEIRLSIVMISISVVSVIYLVEISIAIVLSSGELIDRDTRTIFQVYSDLVDEGFDPVPSIRPTNFVSSNGVLSKDNKRLYPLGGVSKRTTIYCNESGERVIYKSDKYGFRNTSQAWNLKDKVWVVIGDSFAHGACVKDGEHSAARVQSLKPGYSIINLGIGGSGPLIELAILKEYAVSLKPEVIMWFYFEGNDLVQNLDYELTSSLLKNYLRPTYTQKLLIRQDEIDKTLMSYVESIIKQKQSGIVSRLETLVQSSRILRLLNLRRFVGIDNKVWDPEVERLIVPGEFMAILKQAQAAALQWGGEIYFVYVPEYSRYLLENKNDLTFRSRGQVLDLVSSLGIPVIDIHKEVFENHSDSLSLFPRRSEPHYTPEGYKLMGDALVNGIEKNQLAIDVIRKATTQ